MTTSHQTVIFVLVRRHKNGGIAARAILASPKPILGLLNSIPSFFLLVKFLVNVALMPTTVLNSVLEIILLQKSIVCKPK